MARPVDLRRNRIALGRDPRRADVAFPADDNVSGVHAEIRRTGSTFSIADAGSRNGTFVNDKKLGTPVPLADGDKIVIGRTPLRFRGGQLWVPDDAVVRASGLGMREAVPLAVVVGSVVALAGLLWMVRSNRPVEPPTPVGPAALPDAHATAVAMVALTAQVITPPATDTPGPLRTAAPPAATLPPPSQPTATPRRVTAAPGATATARSATVSVPVVTAVPPPPGERLVLADYFAWYDGEDWSGSRSCRISDGDRPQQPYHSDDAETIERHIHMAKGAGIDGFTVHWWGPGDRTDHNFATVLDKGQGAGFRSTVVFSYHFTGQHGVEAIGDALRHVINQYGGHAGFLRDQGKPVIFFVDMERVPGSPIATWDAIRKRVDPDRRTIWIAEGDDKKLPYLGVFDGLYTYKVTHKISPDAYTKLSRYAKGVQDRAQQLGRPLIWVATVMPGWDDLRSACMPDVRMPSQPHRRDREGGGFYRKSFDAALQSNPSWLYVNSFNEWVEGHYIEPSEKYGDSYLELTGQLVRSFKQ